MGFGTFSLLVAALFISLLTHRVPVACARHVALLKMNNGLNNRGDADLAKEPALGLADDFGVKKGFHGRKLGGRNMDEAEVMGVKGDEKDYAEMADMSHHKTKGSQMQQGLAGSAAAAARRPASSQPHMVEMRTAGKHTDPATEIYDMLRRDYTSKASRRRPINNGEPLQEEP